MGRECSLLKGEAIPTSVTVGTGGFSGGKAPGQVAITALLQRLTDGESLRQGSAEVGGDFSKAAKQVQEKPRGQTQGVGCCPGFSHSAGRKEGCLWSGLLMVGFRAAMRDKPVKDDRLC